MNHAAQDFLQKLDGDLLPLRALIERYASADSDVDVATGALRLSHRPKIGTEAYACIFYPGMSPNLVDRYEALQRSHLPRYIDIPPLYKTLLTRLNGAFVFGTALFGIPPSMMQDPSRLDRSVLQPLDLSTANQDWRLEYRAVSTNFFFASGSHSSTENVGYFLTPDNRVAAYLRGGQVIGHWDTLGAFLTAEIERAELRYHEFEQFMGSTKRTVKSSGKRH